MGRLEGKHCIITGGAGSIGLASARRFAEEGARLVVDHNLEALKKAAEEFDPTRMLTVLADVAETADVKRYIDQSVERFGPIDVLFSNAGNGGPVAPVVDYPVGMLDWLFRVHVRGTFLACSNAIPKMRDGGSIVIMSSVVGVMGVPGAAAYVSVKHALMGLVRAIAKEVADRRIRVNSVNPAPVDNAGMRDAEAQMKKLTGRDAGAMFDAMIPLGRHAAPSEVANAALFLASDESSFTTGSLLMVDGGMRA